MTDEETRLDARLEYLSQIHIAGSFEVFFDADACAACIRSENSQLMIPATELKQFAAQLQNLEMTLFLCGITQA
jgi:hypothetical protein